MQYLNGNGLEYLWQKIRDNFVSDSLFARCNLIPVVKGTQTAATNKWLGDLAVDAIADGMCILYFLPFAGTSSAATLTLTLKDGTHAAPVYIANTACTTHIEVNSYALLIYNATLNRWVVAGERDTNTTYTPKTLGIGYGTCDSAAETNEKVVTYASYSLVAGGIVAVYFENDVPEGATLNINAKGAKAIYYRNAAINDGVISAGDTATFMYDGTYYRLLSVDYRDASEVSY